VDGAANLHELQEVLELTRWSDPPPRGVGTVAGLMLGLLKRPPQIADKLEWADLTLEVIDMDGPRIDRVLVTPAPEIAPPAESSESS
jgi:putative hemolysin